MVKGGPIPAIAFSMRLCYYIQPSDCSYLLDKERKL